MARNPLWNQRRNFSRAQVFNVNLPREPRAAGDPSRMLFGIHRSVVLFDSTFPRNTVVVIPITSLIDDRGNRKPTIPSDLILKKSDYNTYADVYKNIIDHDSFLMVNQIRSVTRDHLQDYLGDVYPDDMTQLDFRLIMTLELNETINLIVQRAVQEKLEQLGYVNEKMEEES